MEKLPVEELPVEKLPAELKIQIAKNLTNMDEPFNLSRTSKAWRDVVNNPTVMEVVVANLPVRKQYAAGLDAGVWALKYHTDAFVDKRVAIVCRVATDGTVTWLTWDVMDRPWCRIWGDNWEEGDGSLVSYIVVQAINDEGCSSHQYMVKLDVSALPKLEEEIRKISRQFGFGGTAM
ncbi:hypothetical protein B0J11DRAFT_70308 [Dendryphion nanum]|uniref:F-box domain-containing protein n=1 Tax=Dendryphion nanum TaxID=256645 RepID=A0A9P9DHZ3_9PLEO|nr:hypothetical protein B0J11DRAFT_70308 [Dendryphion nanum]